MTFTLTQVDYSLVSNLLVGNPGGKAAKTMILSLILSLCISLSKHRKFLFVITSKFNCDKTFLKVHYLLGLLEVERLETMRCSLNDFSEVLFYETQMKT